MSLFRIGLVTFFVGVLWMIGWTVLGGPRTSWVGLVLLGLAVPPIVVALVRRRTRGRLVGGLAVCAISGATWWAVLGLMAFPSYDGLSVGSPFPAFSTRAVDGRELDRASLLGEPTLLVFSRGPW